MTSGLPSAVQSRSATVQSRRRGTSRAVSRVLSRAPEPGGGHPSRDAVADDLLRPTRELGRAALERSLSGLAPGGVYRAAPVTRRAGGLLHHRFTLTADRRSVAAVCSLWHCPAGHPGWALPTTLPCGARTFLGGPASRSDAAACPARPPCDQLAGSSPRRRVSERHGAGVARSASRAARRPAPPAAARRRTGARTGGSTSCTLPPVWLTSTTTASKISPTRCAQHRRLDDVGAGALQPAARWSDAAHDRGQIRQRRADPVRDRRPPRRSPRTPPADEAVDKPAQRRGDVGVGRSDGSVRRRRGAASPANGV